MTDYTVYTDGSCVPNPGTGGLGVVRRHNATGRLETRSERRENVTNNYMEVLSVVFGLHGTPEGCSVEVVSDSQYAINCLEGKWSRARYPELFAYADGLISKRNVSFRWVKGHSGDRYNEMADRLASMAITAGKQGDPVSRVNDAMGFDIRVPSRLRSRTSPSSASAWERKYRVSAECAESIMAFIAKTQPRFRDYITLRTGGADSWSSLDEDSLVKKGKVSAAALAGLKDNLEDRRMFLEALRWYCRGLSFEDSVRKVLVNREASSCAAGGMHAVHNG